ncbi:hypothetical protein ACFLSA_07270, partial [Bacteroidota bacterium]
MQNSDTISAKEKVTFSQNGFINPFPGLRPFGIQESHLFYGREGQSEEVLEKLSESRFVAVVGASGSGKSSLMYCGLVPILYGGFITEAGSRWRIITTRPGNDPINNLANSLVKSEDPKSISEEDLYINSNLTKTIMKSTSLGLIEAVKLLKTPVYENILILVDQFEELFRFRGTGGVSDQNVNESEAFVKLLVEAVRQTEVPIYIVLTMRSDFIGDCAKFQDLTELINESNYLIPQMTRDNFKEAILGPVAVGKGKIDPNLIQQLLNDIGDNPDQLPILQHALMRTWDYWVSHRQGDRSMSIEDYESVGKMESALSEHANEAFDELSQREKEICGTMFKNLTERGSDNRGIRRPTRVDEIAKISKAEIEEVHSTVDTFRKQGRSFLTPAYEVPLTDKSVIDISHESLMRIWNRLKVWVEEEASSAQMYQRLAEAAHLFQEGKTGLYRPPDLQLALNWKNMQQPTLEWAQRYHPAFERTIVYLETSEKEHIAAEENKLRLQRRALRRTRMFALVLGSAAIVSLGLMFYSFQLQQQAEESAAEAKRQQGLAEVAQEEAKREALRAQDSATAAQEQRTAAEESATEAKRQQGIAEEASAEAKRQRLLSISQSMAVKSSQEVENKQLKGLLAQQAYIFNLKNEGEEHHADVYDALYQAVKALNPPTFNRILGHEDAINSLVYDDENNIMYSAGSD